MAPLCSNRGQQLRALRLYRYLVSDVSMSSGKKSGRRLRQSPVAPNLSGRLTGAKKPPEIIFITRYNYRTGEVMQSKFCFYYFSALSRASRAASVSKTCPKVAVFCAARPICFTLVSLSLSPSPRSCPKHTQTHARTRGATHERGDTPGPSPPPPQSWRDERAACVLLLQIATAAPTAECLHSDAARRGAARASAGLRTPRCVKWKPSVSVRSGGEDKQPRSSLPAKYRPPNGSPL